MTEPTGALRDLARVADALGTATRPASAHNLVAEVTAVARAVFGAAACSLALLSEDGTELVFTTIAGEGEQAMSGMRMPAGAGIAGWVAMTGQPLAVADVRQDTRFASDVADATGIQPTSILAAPVATDAALLGVIEVLDRDRNRAAADNDLQLLAMFGRQAAVALEAAQQFDRLGRVLFRAAAAMTDGDLAAALLATADEDGEATGPLAGVAAAFADLAQRGEAEQELAADLLRRVASYTGRESGWA